MISECLDFSHDRQIWRNIFLCKGCMRWFCCVYVMHSGSSDIFLLTSSAKERK